LFGFRILKSDCGDGTDIGIDDDVGAFSRCAISAAG
jgi:hypothetical protein